jgi:uncharacterized protein YgbK (DUF1537 family)
LKWEKRLLAIIADDLTGALDTGAPFAARGLHVEVALDLEAVPHAVALAPEVLSVNLASREGSAEQAQDRMRQVYAQLPPGTRLFKKVDSRLKGHVAVELDAVPYTRALVAPAIPAFGRIVRDGNVEGFGVEKPISVVEALRHHAGRCLIVDAASDSELLDALTLAEAEHMDLLIGARGLAEALAIRMSGRTEACLVQPPVGHGLFAIGSHDRITLQQIDRLLLLDGVDYRAAPNGVLAEPLTPVGPLVLIQATPGEVSLSGEQVGRNLATSIHPKLTAGARTLLLSGGATAETILAEMGIHSFRLQGECLPGLGLAYAGGQCIIAKSGGFGGPDTLATLAEKLHEGRG